MTLILSIVSAERCNPDVINDDSGTFFGKCDRYGLTDPRTGSRNDGYLCLVISLDDLLPLDGSV